LYLYGFLHIVSAIFSNVNKATWYSVDVKNIKSKALVELKAKV